MSDQGLTQLQRRTLTLLAGIEPAWTLTGGAALIGVHGVPRATRDLDLLFRGLTRLDRLPAEVTARLVGAGLDVASLQAGETHHALRVSDGSETLVVDLIAEPVVAVEAPEIRAWGEVTIQVDSAHELLVNKLCALLHRSELRDLDDIGQLLAAGGDLDRALDDAPRKEAGFSPLTLAWLLSELPIAALAEASSATDAEAATLTTLRERLVETLEQRSRDDG